MHRLTRLPNGLTVATATMPHMASVCLGVWVGVGSRYETDAQSGAAHFIEHLLFKGTRRRTARQISEEVEGVGGWLDAFTSWEHTCFQAKARHDCWPVLLDVLLDMVLNSRFTPGEIAKERNVLKEEIAMDLDHPEQLVQELLNATLWPDHPLGRPITGTPATLDGLRRPELTTFHWRHYLAARTVVVAAGNVRHADFVRAVIGQARHFRCGPAPVFAPAAEQPESLRVRWLTRPVEQAQLALGLRTVARHNHRRYAVSILNTLTGENTCSRLFQVLREDAGLVYAVHSACGFFADTGDLTVTAGLDSDNLPRALRLMARELRRLAERPVGQAELRRARDWSIGQFDLALESTEGRMGWLGEQLINCDRHTTAATIKDRLASVRAAEVQAAARDFFRPERLGLALVSPLKRAAHLAAAFR
jgi:predicted Zn-dependent peptidase